MANYPDLFMLKGTDVRFFLALYFWTFLISWGLDTVGDLGEVFNTLRTAVNFVKLVSGVLSLVGVVTFLFFFRHATRCMFNRRVTFAWNPLLQLFLITKPLEMIWRFATCWLRVTPDILIVGEAKILTSSMHAFSKFLIQVRCGTTSLADHLKSLPGARGPFCAFHHPLDGKESFYYSGHYFGLVNPYMYRAMFPLAIEKWWATAILKKPFFVFDGCAQYLTAPWAPPLLQKSCGSNLGILVCLREPVSQNISWWKYEQGVHVWGDSMGMAETGDGLDSMRMNYPPKTLKEAYDLSESEEMLQWYNRGVEIGLEVLQGTANFLPEWATTWPNGQLANITRNGAYVTNIKRYLKWFPKKSLRFIEVNELSSDLPSVLDSVNELLPSEAVGFTAESKLKVVKLNVNAAVNKGKDEYEDTRKILKEYYKPFNKELFSLIGKTYDW
eukprot:m.255840 g.255840  ORF g.255840 m.255840 type:complete len:442 (+) comp16185_c0_seq4:2183-3508(+)